MPAKTWFAQNDGSYQFQNMRVIEKGKNLYTCELWFRGAAIYSQLSRGSLRSAKQTITRSRNYLLKESGVQTDE